MKWPLVWRTTLDAANAKRAYLIIANAGLEAQRDAALIRERTTARSYSEQQRIHQLWEQRDAMHSFQDNPRSYEALAAMHEMLVAMADQKMLAKYDIALRTKFGPHIVDPIRAGMQPYLSQFENDPGTSNAKPPAKPSQQLEDKRNETNQ